MWGRLLVGTGTLIVGYLIRREQERIRMISAELDEARGQPDYPRRLGQLRDARIPSSQ